MRDIGHMAYSRALCANPPQKKADKKLSIFEHGLDDSNKGKAHRFC